MAVKLTKAQVELARSFRRALTMLAKRPNGSGAINGLAPRNVMRAFVSKGLAEISGEDRLGEIYSITATGRAALEAQPTPDTETST